MLKWKTGYSTTCHLLNQTKIRKINFITSNVKSLDCWFLSFSISLRNFDSFTSKPPNSVKIYKDNVCINRRKIPQYNQVALRLTKQKHTDPGSAPTSSMNTLPNNSRERRQRPSSISWEITIPMKLHCGLWNKNTNNKSRRQSLLYTPKFLPF